MPDMDPKCRAALEEAEICLTRVFRDAGRRQDACIAQIQSLLKPPVTELSRAAGLLKFAKGVAATARNTYAAKAAIASEAERLGMSGSEINTFMERFYGPPD